MARGWVISVSPDAKHLLVTDRGTGTNADVGLVSLEDGEMRTLLGSRWDEEGAVFSPDGKMIAYATGESGRREVYVQPFPELDSRTQVSSDGGAEPVWARDGKKLYFRRGRSIFVSDVQTSPVFSASRPVKLLEGDYGLTASGMASYDVAPEGNRFVMFRSTVSENQVEVRVILNWFEELKAGR